MGITFATPDKEAQTAHVAERYAKALAELVPWLVRGEGEDRLFLRGDLAGWRTMALAWVLHPNIF